MLLKAVAFDLDNTLASISNRNWLKNPSSLKKMIALRNSCAVLRGFRSFKLPMMLEKEFQERTASSIPIAVIDREAARLYRQSKIPKAIKNLIQACDKQQIPRAVLSDHPAILKLKELEMSDGWTCVLNARHYGALKPLPDALYALCSQLGVHPCELLYIGDRYDTDEQACFKIGCSFIHVEQIDVTHILSRFS